MAESQDVGHILVGASGTQPGSDYHCPSALGADDGLQFIAPHGLKVANRRHHVGREDVLPQPAVLERADPQAILGEPAPTVALGALVG